MRYFIIIFSICCFSIVSLSQTTISKQRINFVDEFARYYSTTPHYGFTNPIFPDTNIIVDFASISFDKPWLHGIVQTYDLSGELLNHYSSSSTYSGGIFDPGHQPFDTNIGYTIDSILIPFAYIRVDTNVVDTAIVSIIARGNGNYKRTYVAGLQTYFHVDDVNQDNEPDSSIWLIKIPLNNAFYADSNAHGYYNVKLAPNFTIQNSGGIFGLSLVYKSGRAYSILDTTGRNMNFLRMVYCTPNGPGTSYTGFSGVERSIGSFSDDSTRYFPTTAAHYSDVFKFVGHHPYQLYNFSFDISQTNMLSSVQEISDNNFALSCFPNPAVNEVNISYSLSKESEAILEVRDEIGKIIIKKERINSNIGINKITISTNDLSSGIYFYSILINGTKVTKKMVVNH